MPSFADITIAGHAGQDAETKTFQSGKVVTEFSVAVNNYDDSTTWYRVSVWGKYGQAVAPYITKGCTIMVSGEFQPRTYERKDGTEGVSYDIMARRVVVAGSGGGNSHSEPEPEAQNDIPF